jgi:hypothetical protein
MVGLLKANAASVGIGLAAHHPAEGWKQEAAFTP